VFSPTSLASLVSVERGLVASSLGISGSMFYTAFP
jgi:hypothetical protein